MNDNGELNQLDRLVLINTAIFYKLMLDDEARDKEFRQRLDDIEQKINILLQEVLKNDK